MHKPTFDMLAFAGNGYSFAVHSIEVYLTLVEPTKDFNVTLASTLNSHERTSKYHKMKKNKRRWRRYGNFLFFLSGFTITGTSNFLCNKSSRRERRKLADIFCLFVSLAHRHCHLLSSTLVRTPPPFLSWHHAIQPLSKGLLPNAFA